MWQLVFYLSFLVYCAVFGLVSILCLRLVGWLTGCALAVASAFVVSRFNNNRILGEGSAPVKCIFKPPPRR